MSDLEKGSIYVMYCMFENYAQYGAEYAELLNAKLVVGLGKNSVMLEFYGKYLYKNGN